MQLRRKRAVWLMFKQHQFLRRYDSPRMPSFAVRHIRTIGRLFDPDAFLDRVTALEHSIRRALRRF